MKFTLGVCAMETKVESSPMKSILKHLKDSGDFEIIIFPERMILYAPVTEWPVVECLIAFYSLKFPLEKAIEYVKLVKPIILNDLEKQRIMRSRINIYRELQACRIPHPNYLLVDHDLVKKGVHTFEEHYDYIVYNNVRLNKPFIEKPLDSDDHNNWIYYPSNTGGGCKKLFRKIHDRSSEYCPDIHSVRKNGTYIYEEFMLTYGTDIKVYAVGSMFAHAEARKSPTLDGKVNRYSDGKEYRYPIILTTEEKTIAYRIVDHFGQTVCGFDILRTFDGPYVCDVNGWSFVKRNKKYHIDCCQIMRAIFLLKLQAKYNILIDSVLQNKPQGYQVIKTEFGDRLIDSGAVSGAAARVRRLTAIGSKFDNSLAGVASKDATIGIEMDSQSQGLVESDPENSLETKLGDKSDKRAHRDSSNKSNEELCSVIVVMRHADRKPKHKLKFFTRRQEILDYFTGNESEVKLKSSEELITMCQVNDQIIADLEEKIAFINSTSSSLDASAIVGDGANRANIGGLGSNLMSNSHADAFNRAATGCIAAINRANNSAAGLNQLLLEFNYHKEFQRILKKGYEFLGINRKVQLKAVYAPSSGSPNADDGSASCTSGDESSGKEASFRKIEKVLVIAKCGGDLTDVGKCQAEDLGRKLRQTLYPADSGALIRLHSTYRHDFKIFSSDEGRCQITGAAFTKGILDLEGELTPILVAMTIRNKKAYQLLNETFIVEERTKCRYKLDELITHFGSPEYEEILQEMPEYDRYYYNKALEDAEFSQDDLVNLSKLIRYYIATLNKEEMMWSSLYSVDDYAFHIVNKLSGMQNRWGQLLLKFHKPPCVGYGRINSDLLSRLNAGALGGVNGPYRKLDSNLLDRIYGTSGRSGLEVMCSSKPGWKATADDNSHRSVCTYSNSAPCAKHLDADSEINGGKNGTSGSPFRDDEAHSSDYCPEERYDYTKLSDIVDNIRYDLIHMHQLLGQALETAFEIYRIVERLSSVISPCEYGVTPIEKLQIGAKIAWNLLKKIQHDVSHQRVRMTPHTYQDNLLTGPTSSVNTASLAGASVRNISLNSVVPTMNNTQRDSSSSLNESGLAPENVLNPESLNSNNLLDYDIDFMVNNDTSAASIAANSLATQGTYLDSSKIFENGKCFIGGIKPTEMYQFNSNTRTECLWTTLSGKSTCISSNSSDTSTVNAMAAQASPASSKNSVHSSKHKSLRFKHGSHNGSRSGRLSSVGSKDSGDGNNDDSLLLNSYSLWLHMSPSENQPSDEFSTDDVSNLVNTGHPMASSLNSTSIPGRGAMNSGGTNSSSAANDTDPNKLNTPPKKPIVNSHLNRLDPNQGWGWDEKIFDDLIRLDTNEDLGIRSQQRVVRSRYYVTSASHLFSVLNFFKYAHLLDDSFDTNLKHIENINDLHYLSHIVIRVWRSRGSEGFFNRLEILVSSGAKDGFGQNLGILEQSARNQKNKYKRHIQRYKLHAMQEPNCPRCPIFLNGAYGMANGTADNQLGVSINSDGYGHSNFHTSSGMVSTYSSIGSTFDDMPIRIAPTSKDDGATGHLSLDGGCSSKNMGQNAHSPRSLNSPLNSSGSDIVGRYNLMVGDLNDRKYKCFKCFIEQYRSSDLQNIAPSPKIGQRDHLHHNAGSSPANVAVSTAESVNDFGSVAATAGSAIDTAGSCLSGMDNRAEGSASNKTVPPYCELNSLVVMNRNFGLDRLNNLIEKTYEQIISKG